MHRKCGDLLPFYVAGVLSAAKVGAVERHLANCVACREAVREWRVVSSAVRAEASGRMGELPALSSTICAQTGAGQRQVLLDGRREASGPTARPAAALWWKRATIALAASAISFLLLITSIWPGALTAAAQGLEALMRSLVLGGHTTIQQVSLVTATPTKLPTLSMPLVVEQRGGFWVIRTAIGSFTSPAELSGRDASLRHFDSFAGLQEALPFELHEPRYLPAGYGFREAMLTPLYRVFLIYDGPEGNIILLQMPVGVQPTAGSTPAPGRGPRTPTEHPLFAVVEMLTDAPIESVELSGQQAAWVGNRNLMWEADGVNFILGGTNLSLDEVTRIAESLN